MDGFAKVFKLLAAVLGSLGMVLSTVENFRHFSASLEDHFWAVLIISCVLSIAAAWPKPAQPKVLGPKDSYKTTPLRSLLKYRWVFVIILAFSAVGYYRYHLINTKSLQERPVIDPGDIPIEPWLSLLALPTLYTQDRSKGPNIVQFVLRPEKTLYVETSTGSSYFRRGASAPTISRRS